MGLLFAFHRAAQAEHQYQQVGIRVHGRLHVLAQWGSGAGGLGRAVVRVQYARTGLLPGSGSDRRYAEGEAKEQTSSYF